VLLRLDESHWFAADQGTWRILRRKPGRGEPTQVVGTYTSVTHAWQCARATGLPKAVVVQLGELVAAGGRAEEAGDGLPEPGSHGPSP
jgi:hypothetical protein